MKSLARPRGPLPARVYWFRRGLVLALGFGLVFGVAQLLDRSAGSGGSPDDVARVVGAAPTPTTTAPSGTSTTDAVSRQGGPKADRAGTSRQAEKTRTPLAQPTGPCRNEEVVVSPKVRGEAYAGRVVHLRLKLTTTGTPACTWTVSPESVVVKITSGPDRIWSSQDCPDAVPQTDVVVRKDVPAKVDMGWRGQRSDSECTRQPDWALPGFYHVTTAAFGAEPTDVQFELQPAVVPTRTVEPRPEKSEKDKGERGKRGDEGDQGDEGGGREQR